MRAVLLVVVGILFTGVVLVCGYLILQLWNKLSPGGSIETYTPVIQAILTPATSLITVLFSYLLLDRQYRINREIEKIKLDLGERYKRESDAYLQLWKAVSSSYRTIATIETRKLTERENDRLTSILSEAEPYSFVLSSDDEERFYDYFQQIENLRASAAPIRKNEERSELWKKNGKAIGHLQVLIRERYKDAYLGKALSVTDAS